MTILLIESDPFFARIYTKKMEEQGWGVSIATSGDVGVKKAFAEPPSCIVLDLLLPGKHGFEVMEELKENAATASVPVIVLTDLCEPEDVERCRIFGASCYAIKAHVTPDGIVKRIKEITSS